MILWCEGNWKQALGHLAIDRVIDAKIVREIPMSTERYTFVEHPNNPNLLNVYIADESFYDENADAFLSIMIDKPLTPDIDWR